MTRRGRVAVLLIMALILGSCWGDDSGPRAREASVGPPNVIIFMTDDQRGLGTLGVMPQVRRLFGDGGTRFTQAYASTPLCCPYRASLLAGQYSHNTGVKLQKDTPRFKHLHSMERYLQQAGYATAVAGKFLNNWPMDKKPPYFDRYAVLRTPAKEKGYYDSVFNVDGRRRVVRRYSTTFIRDYVNSVLESFESRDDDQPWFALVSPYPPHLPYTPAPQDRGAPIPPWGGNPATRETDISDKPPFARAKASRIPASLRSEQLRSLLSVDRLVRRVFDRLGEMNEDNTLAFFTSDSGYLWGEHGLVKKKWPYTESIAIPLLMRWPGQVARATTDRFVSNVDVLPTVLEAARIEAAPAHELDGRSLLGDGPNRERVLTEYFEDEPDILPSWASIRTSSYHYIE
ncbi:MAG: sulfatase-like hydrolase/transferase, partial [Actinomycetota bacterium]